MRIVIMGTGGTGGYFGGLLAKAGEDVTFIARGEHLKALRTQGLTVKSRIVGDFTLAVNATDDPREIETADLILFCVKTYDTSEAAKQLRPLVRPETLVLPVQNGIDTAEQLKQSIEEHSIIGAAAYVTSQVESPGVIAQTAGAGTMLLGELAGGQSSRTQHLQGIFQRAGIATTLPDDIRIALWQKFLFICAFSGVTALTRLSLGQLFAYQETSDLLRGVMSEVEALARARGIALPANTAEQSYASLSKLEAWAKGSMAFDLLAHRRLEVEALNGTVVRLGHENMIPTPLNFAIYAALKPYSDGTPTEIK
ncbi:MAG: 2-dehydropantoate 2-reductase [Ktedonobacteraceae bacterium]